MKKYNEGVEDCNKAIQIDGNNVKTFLRRATCFMALENYEDAVRDYERYFPFTSNISWGLPNLY